MRLRLTALAVALVFGGSAASCDDYWVSRSVEAAAVHSGGQDLAVFVVTCGEAELDVEETSEAIQLTARARVTAGADCFGGVTITFRLDEPLGDRPVIDTYSDDEVHVAPCGDPPPDSVVNLCADLAS